MKRKKLFGLIFALSLLLTSCDSFGHTHEWSPFMDNGDGTHYRMCYKDSRHIDTSEHNFVEEILVEATDSTPGKILKKCIDCGHEEEIRTNPTGQHIYDQNVISEKYLYEKGSDYSAIYYKSSTDGAFGDDTKLFEKTSLPNGYSSIEYLQGSGTEFIDTGIEKTEDISINYNSCKRGNGRLPYGYQEVEYIEFTGTQFIDSKIFGNAIWNFDLQWTLTQKRQLMGYSGSAGEYFGVRDGYYGIYSATDTPIGNRDNVKFDYESSKAGLYVNDICIYKTITDVNVSEKSFLIGALGSNFFCTFKLYSCFATKNGNKVAEYVPCYNTETGEIGLFDLVTYQFIENSGTGNFLKGNDVTQTSRLPSDYQEVEYLVSKGGSGAYICTDYIPNQDSCISVEFEISNFGDSDVFLYGAGGETYTDRTFEVYTWGGNLEYHYAGNSANLKHNGTHFKLETNANNFLLGGDDTDNGSLEYKNCVAPVELTLFAINRLNQIGTGNSDCKIFNFEIKENNIKIHNYVPSYLKRDGTPGLFDLVTNEFLTNSGTGNFEVGSDVNNFSRLPTNFTEVQYLESTGTQFIDTQEFFGNGFGCSITYEYTEFVEDTDILGTDGNLETNDKYAILLNIDSEGQRTVLSKGDNYVIDHSPMEIGQIYTSDISFKNGHYSHTYGAQNIQIDCDNFDCSNPLYLFGRYVPGKSDASSKSKSRIYSCKFYKDNILVKNLVPCIKKNEYKPGFYDLIGNEFFSNCGSGEFEVGPDVSPSLPLPSNFEKLDYIEGTGTQFIDTGCIINKNDNAILTLDYAANDNERLWLGANWYLQFSNSYLKDTNRHFITIENVNGFETVYCDNSLLLENDFRNIDQVDLKLGLFKIGNDNNTWHTSYEPMSGKLYRSTLTIDDVLIFDLVPCIDNNTGKIGLYDLVKCEFLTNCGEGDFVAGYTNHTKVKRNAAQTENVKVGYRYISEEPSYFYGRIYDATIYNGTTIVQKLIPALRNSDSVVGMYDLINDKFYETNGNFKNGGVIGHHLDNGVITKNATLDEEGDITYTCSICGAQIHKKIPRLAYKVSFTYDEGIKEIRVHYDNDPAHYEVKDFAYTRNPFSFNYSNTNSSVWFEIVYNEGYEFNKIETPPLSCFISETEGIVHLLLIHSDLQVNITSKPIN